MRRDGFLVISSVPTSIERLRLATSDRSRRGGSHFAPRLNRKLIFLLPENRIPNELITDQCKTSSGRDWIHLNTLPNLHTIHGQGRMNRIDTDAADREPLPRL